MLLFMQVVSTGGNGSATTSLSVSSGSEMATGSSGVTPERARYTHLTTGAAPWEPNPDFSRYPTTVKGCDPSVLKAPKTDESFHGKLYCPWAVPVLPATDIALSGYPTSNSSSAVVEAPLIPGPVTFWRTPPTICSRYSSGKSICVPAGTTR